MAACSEQEVDGNPSETTLHRTSLLSSKNDDREQYNLKRVSDETPSSLMYRLETKSLCKLQNSTRRLNCMILLRFASIQSKLPFILTIPPPLLTWPRFTLRYNRTSQRPGHIKILHIGINFYGLQALKGLSHAFHHRQESALKLAKIEKQNKPQDLKNLSDDEFLNLLEEASTFNKPSNQASDLLQQLRNEIAEKDSCGNVDQSESSHNADHGTLVYGRNRKSRNTFTKSRGSHGMDILLADALSVGTHSCSSVQKPLENHINKKKSGVIYKSKEDPSVKGITDINRLNKTGLQSQSLQDLATTKLDSLESIRNIGIGRGTRRFHKSQRASSFTSSEVSEHAAQLHLSALEPIRTSLKDANSTFSKFRQNSLPLDGASSERNALSVNSGKGVSSVVRSNCAALEDSEVLNSSPERTCNNHLGCTGINKGSSCDNVCNRFKYETSNLSSKTSSLREYKNSSAISIVSPLELELKEIKVKNKGETDNIAENMIEHIYHQRCDSKTYKDNTDVDVSVGFPLNCGHLKSQYNLVPSSMESISSDQGLPNVLKGIHCENKSNGDDRTQKKKKKNLRQENADGNVFQDMLPTSSFIRSFDDSRQFCAVDINGNPKSYHSGSKVPYGITAVLPSSTFDCYSPGGSFHSENHSKSDLTLRKSKRNRNNIDNQKYIMAEQIAGHRGQEDIDSLLDFINSSDNKVKATKTNGSSNGSNQMCTSGGKHLLTLETEKKKEKISVKTKHHPSCNKRKPSHLSSEEDESQEKVELQEKEIDSKHIPAVEDFIAKDEMPLISKWSDDNEIPLDTEEKLSSTLSMEEKPNLRLLISANFSPVPTCIKDCAASNKSTGVTTDIYDSVGQQKFEESEFRVVLKKQRKRYPLRKSDSSRRCYSNSSNSGYNDGHQYFDQTSHKDDIMLLRGLPLSHRSQRNKQDCTRRKSTSSVPPSEHSSADNSDLDSVHSLPVSGSVPPPTRTHPHTTPPSTSSTPQASYADIARMSIAPTPRSYCNLYGTFACNIEQNALKSDSTSVLADLLSSSIDCPDNISEKDGNNNNHLPVLSCAETTLENSDSIEKGFASDDNKTVYEESLQSVEDSISMKNSCEVTSQEISVPNCSDNIVDDSATSQAKCITDNDFDTNKEIDKSPVGQNSYNSDVLNNPKSCENNHNTVGKTNISYVPESQAEDAAWTEMQKSDVNQPIPNNALLNTSALTETIDGKFIQQTITTSDIHCSDTSTETFVDTNLGNPKQLNTKTLSRDNELDTSTLTEQLCFSGRQDRPPVIIMDNYLPTENACGVSFGIEPDELLRLSTGGSVVTNTSHTINSATSISTVSETSQVSEGATSCSSISVVNTMHEKEKHEQQPYDSSSSPSSIVFLSNEDSLIQGQNVTSSPSSKVLLLKSGQPLHWREMDADKRSFNFYQIVGFLGNTWEILQDCDPGGGSSQGNQTGRISYYSDQ